MRKNTLTGDLDGLTAVLGDLNYSTKTRGGKNGDDKTVTFCQNPKTPRLTLPKRFVTAGYTAGLAGLAGDGTVTVVLVKTRYNDTFTALHKTQHFLTVVGKTTVEKLLTSHTWGIKTEKTENGFCRLTLTPNGD